MPREEIIVLRNILIIDNEGGEASALARAFEAHRMPTFVYPSGQEALTAVRNMKLALAIGCITLPGENILEIFRSLKALPGHDELPCVLILPGGAEYSPDDVLSYGIVDAFMRPIHPLEAVKRVQVLLGVSESDSQLDKAVETVLSDPQGRKTGSGARRGGEPSGSQLNLLDEAADTVREPDNSSHEMTREGRAGSPRFHKEGQVFDDPVDKLNADLKRSIRSAQRTRILIIGVTVLLFGGLAALLFTGGDSDREPTAVKEVREPVAMPGQSNEIPVTEPVLQTPEREEPFGEILRQELGRVETERTASKASGGGEVLSSAFFSVQVGAFALEANAEDLTRRLNQKGYDAFIKPQVSSSGKTLHRVLVGRYADRESAGDRLLELAKRENMEGFVTRISR